METLTPPTHPPHPNRACLKAAHFVELCEQRGVPLVFLVHNEDGGENGGVDFTAADFGAAEMGERELFRRAAEAKDVGKLIAAVSAATVPKITLLAGDLRGAVAHAMCGRSSSADFVFAWPTARVGMAMGEGEETTVGGTWADIEAAKAAKAGDEQEDGASGASSAGGKGGGGGGGGGGGAGTAPMRDAFYAASRLWIDSVIPFDQTRETLALTLRLCERKQVAAPELGDAEWQQALPPLRL